MLQLFALIAVINFVMGFAFAVYLERLFAPVYPPDPASVERPTSKVES